GLSWSRLNKVILLDLIFATMGDGVFDTIKFPLADYWLSHLGSFGPITTEFQEVAGENLPKYLGYIALDFKTRGLFFKATEYYSRAVLAAEDFAEINKLKLASTKYYSVYSDLKIK